MQRKFLRFLALICLSCLPLQAGLVDSLKSLFVAPAAKPPTIKVLLVNAEPKATVEVKGQYAVIDPQSGQQLCSRYSGKKREVKPLEEGLEWGEIFVGVHQIKIVPQHPSVTTVVNGIEYQGSLFLYDIGGVVSVVNEVEIEDYLRSTLALKKDKPLAQEALSAFVIAERTSAYFATQNPPSNYWDISAEGYKGYAVTNRTTPLEAVIHVTRYLVMSRDSEELMSFPSVWDNEEKEGVFSRLPLKKVDQLAQEGKDAKEILSQAFPCTHLCLTFRS